MPSSTLPSPRTLGTPRGVVGLSLLIALSLTSCPKQPIGSVLATSASDPRSGTRSSALYLGGGETQHSDRVVVASAPLAAENEPVATANEPVATANAPAATANAPVATANAPVATANAPVAAASSTTVGEGDRAPSSNVEVDAAGWEPPTIASIGRETWVYSRPTYESSRLGYLRFGSKVKRESKASGSSSCPGGWYRIAPEGYVCNNGRTATTELEHPLANLPIQGPSRELALPYEYAMAKKGLPIFLRGLPASDNSELGTLTSLANWFPRAAKIHGFPLPEDGSGQVVGLPGSGVAFTAKYASKSKAYALTPSLELVERSVFEGIEPSAFVGLALDEKTTLPIAFVTSKSGLLYRSSTQGGPSTPLRALAYRQALAVVSDASEHTWVKTVDGDYVRRDQVTIIGAPRSFPSWVRDAQVWLDVSIERQALVAYVGKVAKYVTLVSTGVDGLSDPKTSKATKQGVFSIVSKHVTITMDGQDETHAYEMRDVPWVQYFSEGYALHAAYWHDGFGQPKSHGCVNLSPRDARFLFHFTDPGVPVGWHGRTVQRDAATVYVH